MPSRTQANVAGSLAENVNVALVSSVSAGGPVSETSGAVTSTTRQECVAVPVLPDGSVAATAKVCSPSASPLRVTGDVQPVTT